MRLGRWWGHRRRGTGQPSDGLPILRIYVKLKEWLMSKGQTAGHARHCPAHELLTRVFHKRKHKVWVKLCWHTQTYTRLVRVSACVRGKGTTISRKPRLVYPEALRAIKCIMWSWLGRATEGPAPIQDWVQLPHDTDTEWTQTRLVFFCCFFFPFSHKLTWLCLWLFLFSRFSCKFQHKTNANYGFKWWPM